MQVPIDISLYPLNKEFILPIDDFIDNLKRYKNIEVQTNPISTQLFGEFNDLIKIIEI
tara:strand:+ start:1011 stop:1184 length:174 start_codon:yes stop_codon:yes gene_type:complete